MPIPPCLTVFLFPREYAGLLEKKRIEILCGIIERAIDEVRAGVKIQPTTKKYEIYRYSLQQYLKLERPVKNPENKSVPKR